MLRVTQTKAINQIIQVSQLKKVNSRHNRKKQEREKDQIVTAIVGDSVMKDIYG